MAQARVVLILGAALAVAAASGCHGPDTPPPLPRAEAGPADAAVSHDLEPRPLGLPELAAYGWRKRGGQPAFRLARGSEQAGDWAAVATTCQQALAADPGHLEASWLLAVAFAKLGKPDQLLAPLARAEAGD
ncbi:MAG: hypothetical protein ABIY55_05915, partial [Kofleriaceae bacterium]